MRRLPLVLFALVFAIAFSQVPVFVQEYEQRLGGAIDELARVIDRDRENAQAVGLSLNAFLQKHELSTDEAFHRTGEAMRERIDRHARLSQSAAALDAAPAWKKPLLVAESPDREIVRGAWERFRPTLALDPVFGLAGLVLALLLRDLGVALGRALFGKRKTGRLPR